jgi:ELWxxDGT repeat protein
LVFFPASDGASGTEPFVSDGTPEGTGLLKDLAAAGNASLPTTFIGSGGSVFFVANDQVNGRELWITDGTEVGTALLSDIRPGSASSTPNNLYDFGGILYFAASDGVNGIELWKSDGTPIGTVLEADIRPGSGAGSPAQFFNIGSRLYFVAASTASNRELWALDTGIALEGEGDGGTDGEGSIEGDIEGGGEGEGAVDGEGESEGSLDGEGGTEGEGSVDGEGAAEGEGAVDGEGAAEGEGAVDGEGSFEGEIIFLDLPEISTRILEVYPVLDADGDGYVTRLELADYLLSVLENLFNNPKGGINFEDLAEEAFNLLDKNGDDQLSVGELRDEAGANAPVHAIDQDADGAVSLSELLRAIQLYNSSVYSCAINAGATEDGYVPGSGDTACVTHASDYQPADFIISLSELLRAIQFYNSGGLTYCPETLESEDSFCAGVVG